MRHRDTELLLVPGCTLPYNNVKYNAIKVGLVMKKLRTMRLTNFRAFSDFTIRFSDNNYLIGPNNAGKTTILTALRISDNLLRHSMSRKTTHAINDGELGVNVYPISVNGYQSILDSIHHDFKESEARIELSWTDNSKLIAVWPPAASENDPYFYLLIRKNGAYIQPGSMSKVREQFERLGVIPIMAPIEDRENVLGEDYVKSSADTRIASRHFRNNLYILKNESLFEGFEIYLKEWMPDIKLNLPVISLGDTTRSIDVYYREDETGPEKELVWSGDGIQIWLQILFHIYRISGSGIVVLDEPEVYLHADLQRRLVRLLESLDAQVILATHSAEVIAETNSDSIVMIDKSRKNAIRVRSESKFDELSEMVGTALNLRLVRALKTKVVLFVEGNDMKLINLMCTKLGLKSLEREYNITTILLKGKNGNKNVLPFRWLHETILSNTKEMYVILDKDYQTDIEREQLETLFEESGVNAHIWRRKEIESYFINPSVIARVTQRPILEIDQILLEASDMLANTVLGQLVNERTLYERKIESRKDPTQIFTEVKDEFDINWENLTYRLATVPAKKLLSNLNGILNARGVRTFSIYKLALSHEATEVPEEMVKLLTKINTACETN